MNEISFRRTSNIFLNAGIVALRWYLENYEHEFTIEYSLASTSDVLIIRSDNLFKLLEVVYYVMGTEVYDTSGKNARGIVEKYYFSKLHEPVGFHKMRTYGLGELITNDPTPKASPKGRKIKFEKLVKEDKPFALEIAKFYNDKNLKLKEFQLINHELLASPKQKGDSEIFIDAPYTKTTKIDFDEKYFESGEQVCYLTGERYKKLVDTTNTSPFLSGLDNFSSYLTPTSQKISWKALYLSQFSPKLCLYKYVSGLDSIVCYFFISDNLENTYKLFLQNSSFYSDQNELIEGNYMANFKVYNVSPRKDDEQRLKPPSDFTERSEILFILIYTFYRQFLFSKSLDKKVAEDDYDPMSDFDSELPPISLVSFQADKFASTLRPNAFEEFNNFKFIVSLISYLERNGIQFSQLLPSLKFLKNSDRNSKNSYRLERQIRDQLLEGLLNQKSIISIITSLFYQCYTYLLSGDTVGYKRYDQLKLFTELYEPIIKFGGNHAMNKEIQNLAIKLGTSIGQGILRFADDSQKLDEKNNARNGRKYIIGLYKARNLNQFLDAIIRLQNKYKIVLNKELIPQIDQQNFEYVKQFSIISALNQINATLIPSRNENQ